MFSIGLTLLSCTNLQDHEVLYTTDPVKFNCEKFDETLSELVLNNGYSEILRSCIINLCSYEPKNRMALH